MGTALGLAARGLGRVRPNPTVGCVLVNRGAVVGRGWTQPGGRPHAETEALGRAGAGAEGATAYVTLEPCSHHGKTPPCAEALVDAGIARAVVAVADPDPRVSGSGLARLRDAGVDVLTGVCEAEARALNAGFFSRVLRGRPHITLKTATSMDGRIAAHTGHSQWITGEPARARSHYLRAVHDAILVGSRTVMADDPALTCRLPGIANQSPVRVVVDSSLQTPLTARIVREARQVPTWFIVTAEGDKQRRQALEDAGVDIITVDKDANGYTDLEQGLKMLAERGINSVLVEGGGTVTASLLQAGLIDQVAWFHAPKVIGGDGIAAVAALGIDSVGEAPTFEMRSARYVGDDVLVSMTVRT